MPYRTTADRQKYQRDYYAQHGKQKRRMRAGINERDEKKVLVAIRLPVSIVARIQRLVSEGIAIGNFPWKTQTECVKALVLRGFESLAGDESVDAMLPYLRAVHTIESVGQHRKEAQAAFSAVKGEIAELLHIKANDEAVHYFHGIYSSVRDMDENVWRNWLLQQLESTFPQLLKEKPKGISITSKHDRMVERRQRRDRRRAQEEADAKAAARTARRKVTH